MSESFLRLPFLVVRLAALVTIYVNGFSINSIFGVMKLVTENGKIIRFLTRSDGMTLLVS